jgi:hypothetical protein
MTSMKRGNAIMSSTKRIYQFLSGEVNNKEANTDQDINKKHKNIVNDETEISHENLSENAYQSRRKQS